MNTADFFANCDNEIVGRVKKDRGDYLVVHHYPGKTYYVTFPFHKAYKYIRVAPFFGNRLVFGLFDDPHHNAYNNTGEGGFIKVASKTLVEHILTQMKKEYGKEPLRVHIPFTFEADDCISIKL